MRIEPPPHSRGWMYATFERMYATSRAKAHILSLERLEMKLGSSAAGHYGHVGGDHFCPLRKEEETGLSRLALITHWRKVEAFKGSLCPP